MQVLLTIVVLAAVASWMIAVQRRLEQLRGQVKSAWRILEADRTNVAVRSVYNKHVMAYNAALEAFPASIMAPLTGFKPAKQF